MDEVLKTLSCCVFTEAAAYGNDENEVSQFKEKSIFFFFFFLCV